MTVDSPTFVAYQKSFPSEEFLVTHFGSKLSVLKQQYCLRNRILLTHGPMRIFTDVSFAEARHTGLLRISFNPIRWIRFTPWVLSKKVFYATHDPYVDARKVFDNVLRVGPMLCIRGDAIDDPADPPGPIMVFENGSFSELILSAVAREIITEGFDDKAQADLCDQFIRQYYTGAFHEDSWWRWRVDGNSVRIEVIPGEYDKRCQERARRRKERKFVHATSY